jgi:stage III sporulation protein AD
MMIDIIKIASIGLVSCFLILAVKQEKPELALGATLAAGVIIFGFCASYVASFIDYITRVCEYAGIELEFIGIILKVIGVSYICEFAGGVCEDSGSTSLASKINLGGKVAIISLSLPIVKSILDLMLGLLS